MLSCLVTHAIRGRLAPRFIFRSLTGGDIKLPTSYLLYSSVLQDTLPPPSEVGDGDNLPFAECTACAYPDEARKELDDMLFKGREHFSPSTRYNLLKWKLGGVCPGLVRYRTKEPIVLDQMGNTPDTLDFTDNPITEIDFLFTPPNSEQYDYDLVNMPIAKDSEEYKLIKQRICEKKSVAQATRTDQDPPTTYVNPTIYHVWNRSIHNDGKPVFPSKHISKNNDKKKKGSRSRSRKQKKQIELASDFHYY